MDSAEWGNGVLSRQEQHKLKRMAILRMAARLFNQDGFRQTTLRQLAQQLNVTKPALYRYVKNKDDILEGILELAMVDLREMIGRVNSAEITGIEKVRRFAVEYGDVMTDDFGACLILTRISALDSRFRQQYQVASREVFTALRGVVREGISDGSIRACDPKYAASALLGTLNETVYWYLVNGKESARDSAEAFFNVFEFGLVAPAKSPADPPAETTSPRPDQDAGQ